MTNLLKSLYDILNISTKMKKREEEVEKHIIIEAVNECGEKRYIQVKKNNRFRTIGKCTHSL